MRDLDIIFACCDAGVHVDGASNGAYKLYEEIDYKNKKIIKQNNFIKEREESNKEKNLKEVNAFNTKLYKEVIDSLNNKHKVLTIGGDHSIAIGSVLGSVSVNDKMGIIWIDAHGDYNTFKTTITGNLHGLPLAVIDGYETEKLKPFHNGNTISPKNTVIIGGRDFDKEEINNLNDAGVTIFSVDDIRKMGTRNVVNEAIKIASKDVNKVHISYDIDVIDPKYAPGVSVPAINGININEAYEIMDVVLKNKDIINSMDIVEFNSLKDKDNITLNIAKNLIEKVLNQNEIF